MLYSPGFATVRAQVRAAHWREIVPRFHEWLSNIESEAAPSLWESIVESTTVSADALAVAHTRFTQEEQGEIHARLEAMAQHIAALDTVTQEQKQLIHTELQNIDEAKGRMDRGEWFRFAVGGILAVLLASDVQHRVAASLMP